MASGHSDHGGAARDGLGPCHAETDEATHSVVLVSGLSGAGKASILRVLEDIGYEAVDNPPWPLVEDLVRGAARDGRRQLALGVDARTHGFDPSAVLSTLSRLRGQHDVRPELVFAWADDDVIQRRFTQTRRRHPLAGEGRVADGLALETAITAPLRAAADIVIDTSNLPLPELRRLVEDRFGPRAATGQARLSVTVLSFAFPAGLPREADMVFDVRFLANPHYVDSLRALTGLDGEVAAFIDADPDFALYFAKVVDLVAFTLPRFVNEGKKYVTVAVGCTGGQHRSVHVVERLTRMLQGERWRAVSLHRDLAMVPPKATVPAVVRDLT